MFVNVACEAAIIGPRIEVGQIAFVQPEDIVPISRVGRKRHDHLDVAVSNDCSIDVHSHKVVVPRLSGAYELIEDMSAVITRGLRQNPKRTAPAMYGMYTPA